ncbi:hypothetical protein [Prosthecobacter sp.]|uniref:hypothetical protein n=1 Tax=Prosthecobacter sp. TaxID=1965333 RepID=UPI001E093B2F|nr:hypothetical protein [Prosthecobacter sp.]MCB1278753.1 hypothetical protein [Prosthecobacter sp.]
MLAESTLQHEASVFFWPKNVPGRTVHPNLMHSSLHTSAGTSVWEQKGITDVVAARALLHLLRRRDLLHSYGGDGESGTLVNRFNDRGRGQGVSLSPNMIAATPPMPELLAYHRSLGLGPERVICPTYRPRVPVTASFLKDSELIARLRADSSLQGIFFRYKDAAAVELAKRLGLRCVGCEASSETYAALNDKSRLAEAGRVYGFETLPVRVPETVDGVPAAFEELNKLYGAGCILRTGRGAGGFGLSLTRTSSQASRAWSRLRTSGQVIVVPFIPPSKQGRNVSLHGYVAGGQFAPVVVVDQIVNGFGFRGARCEQALSEDECDAIRASLPGLGRWMQAAGYEEAPAGVDGFLMRGSEGLRFVVIDPNIRATNTMRPWSVVADLSERTGRRFVWLFEWMVFLGPVRDMQQLSQRLGTDLLNPVTLDQGGILPSVINRFGLGPAGASRMEIIFIGRDPAHLKHLLSRVAELGFRYV